MLETIEAGEQGSAVSRLADDLPLFTSAPRPAPAPKGPSTLEQAFAEIHADELTPREALELIYRLKTIADEES